MAKKSTGDQIQDREVVACGGPPRHARLLLGLVLLTGPIMATVLVAVQAKLAHAAVFRFVDDSSLLASSLAEGVYDSLLILFVGYLLAAVGIAVLLWWWAAKMRDCVPPGRGRAPAHFRLYTGLATTSAITSCLSSVLWPLASLGVLGGHVAHIRCSNFRDRTWRRLSLAGLVIGYLALASGLVSYAFPARWTAALHGGTTFNGIQFTESIRDEDSSQDTEPAIILLADTPAGTPLASQHLEIRKLPNKQLPPLFVSPSHIEEVLGSTLVFNGHSGQPLAWSDIAPDAASDKEPSD